MAIAFCARGSQRVHHPAGATGIFHGVDWGGSDRGKLPVFVKLASTKRQTTYPINGGRVGGVVLMLEA